jgi:hypothetical protein
MMTVGELREILDGLDDEMEVRIAHQPNYPLEFEAAGAEVVDLNEVEDPDGLPERDMDGRRFELPDPQEILYIVEGSSAGTGYLPGIVSKKIGWR